MKRDQAGQDPPRSPTSGTLRAGATTPTAATLRLPGTVATSASQDVPDFLRPLHGHQGVPPLRHRDAVGASPTSRTRPANAILKVAGRHGEHRGGAAAAAGRDHGTRAPRPSGSRTAWSGTTSTLRAGADRRRARPDGMLYVTLAARRPRGRQPRRQRARCSRVDPSDAARQQVVAEGLLSATGSRGRRQRGPATSPSCSATRSSRIPAGRRTPESYRKRTLPGDVEWTAAGSGCDHDQGARQRPAAGWPRFRTEP